MQGTGIADDRKEKLWCSQDHIREQHVAIADVENAAEGTAAHPEHPFRQAQAAPGGVKLYESKHLPEMPKRRAELLLAWAKAFRSRRVFRRGPLRT